MMLYLIHVRQYHVTLGPTNVKSRLKTKETYMGWEGNAQSPCPVLPRGATTADSGSKTSCPWKKKKESH